MNNNLGELEKFDPENYPKIVTEINSIVQRVEGTSVYLRTEILLSYMKDRTVRTEWITANPDVVAMIRSENQPFVNIESLFDMCRWNKQFREAFERYLRMQLAANN